MKKLVLTTVCAMAMAGAVLGQGFVSWGTPFGSITAQTNSTAYSPFYPLAGSPPAGGAVGVTVSSTSGSVYYYELLYTSFSGSQATIPTLASLLTWGDTGLAATNGSVAGRLTPIAANTQAAVPWAAGATDSIVLVGWSANLGSSWGVVSNELATLSSFSGGSFFGISTTGYIAAGSANPGTTVFAAGANAFGLPIQSLLTQLYALPTIPEPTTLALAGLGGLSLLLFRRQRKS